MMKRLTALFCAFFLLAGTAFGAADDISRLYTFTSGTTIQSSQVNAEFNQLVNTMNNKFGRGIANTITGDNTFSGTNTFSGITNFTHASTPIKTDKIAEYSSAVGVTIDGTLLKDGMVTVAGTAASNGTIGYASNQFQGYRNGSLKNFLMAGDASSPATSFASRSSNTIFGTSDSGTLVSFTSTFTQTFTAAATLGSSWYISVRNDGTGVITLDPNSSETIDGLTTMAVYPGESFLIFCDGSNFKTIGRRKSGEVLIQSQSASSSAQLDFTQGLTDTEFKYFVIRYTDLMPATDNVVLWLRVSTDGGSTWRSTAGDYRWAVGFSNGAAGHTSSTSDTEMELNRAVGNATNEGCSGQVLAYNLTGSSMNKRFVLDGMHVDQAGLWERSHGVGGFIFSNAAVNGLRVLFSSGNITSGTVELRGIR